MHDYGGPLSLYCEEPHKTGDKKVCGEYIIETTIQNKMKLDKCGAYIVMETLWCSGRRLYVAAARGAAKRAENLRRRRVEK